MNDVSDKHPTCPKCKGLLKHEPADILGPERVKCILCSWEKYRPDAPAVRVAETVKLLPPLTMKCLTCGREFASSDARTTVSTCSGCRYRIKHGRDPLTGNPLPEPIKAAPIGAQPETRPKDGSCVGCGRPGLVLDNGGYCGRCKYRRANNIDLYLPNQTSGIAAPRKTTAPATIKTETKEISMPSTKTKRGNCPSCRRDDVLMPGPKCSRCYDRIERGVDVITGKPPVKPALAPAILADDEVETLPVTVVKQAKPVELTFEDFHIDVVGAVDEAWRTKRHDFITQLRNATKAAEKLRIAFHTLASVKAMGFEA